MSTSTSCINSNDKIYLTAMFNAMKGNSSQYMTVDTVRDSLKQTFFNNSSISQDSSNIIINKLNSPTSLTDLDSYLDELVDFVNNSCSSSTPSSSTGSSSTGSSSNG